MATLQGLLTDTDDEQQRRKVEQARQHQRELEAQVRSALGAQKRGVIVV
jgi:hypothetical protein